MLFPKHHVSRKLNTLQIHKTPSNNHHWEEKATWVEDSDLNTGFSADVISDLVSGVPIPWVSGMRKGWSHYLQVSVRKLIRTSWKWGRKIVRDRGSRCLQWNSICQTRHGHHAHEPTAAVTVHVRPAKEQASQNLSTHWDGEGPVKPTSANSSSACGSYF